MLEVESGISAEIIAQRGYYSVDEQGKLPSGFGMRQRRTPALAIPVYPPDGGPGFTRLRPDRPRLNKRKPVKYEQPAGRPITLDVHPANLDRVKDADEPLWVTEGEKKADSLTSQGLCTVALFGVECWGKGGELLPGWDHVALHGRVVNVVFDSDVTVKPEVQDALRRFSGALEARGATVRVVYLPETEDGKMGVDDYLVSGGTVEDLYDLARDFDASELPKMRMDRDERLREGIETAWATHEAMPTTNETECTRRAVWRTITHKMTSHGKATRDSVSVYLASNEGAIDTAVSQKTFSRHVHKMEQDGLLKIETPADRAMANRYIFPIRGGSSGTNKENGQGGERERALRGNDSFTGVATLHESQLTPPHEQVPPLRHSRVIVSWRINHELDRRECETSPLLRLGPRRREIVVHLLANGPTRGRDLLARFASESATWRNFRRAVLGPMVKKDFPIIEVDNGLVRLREDWRIGLENAREAGEEHDAEEQQRINYEIKRAAFAQRDDVKPDRAPTEAEMDACRRKSGTSPSEPVADPPSLSPRPAEAQAEAKGVSAPVVDTAVFEVEEIEEMPDPDPVRVDDLIDHPLSCACFDCSAPAPRYALALVPVVCAVPVEAEEVIGSVLEVFELAREYLPPISPEDRIEPPIPAAERGRDPFVVMAS